MSCRAQGPHKADAIEKCCLDGPQSGHDANALKKSCIEVSGAFNREVLSRSGVLKRGLQQAGAIKKYGLEGPRLGGTLKKHCLEETGAFKGRYVREVLS